MKKRILFTISLLFFLFSKAFSQQPSQTPNQQIKTPQQIQLELDQALKDFNTAKKMFIPWYTGPLITGSANNVPKGKYNFQGYLYFETVYAQFNDHRKSIGIPNVYTLEPLLVIQRGLTKWLDITVIGEAFFRWSQSRYAQEFGDTSVTFGFQLVEQDPWVPSIRLTLGESFPTGKFERLNPNKFGIDATGIGAYATVVGLFVNKIIWWLKLHPISLRWAGTYQIANHKVGVKNFNAYGGGFGTDGRVRVGQVLNLDMGIEVSITQKWVFANDFAYAYSTKSTFSGTPGETAPGIPAVNGTPSNDNFSIAPAIEYNVSDTAGFIGGLWFSITGRNSGNFVSLVLSYTQLF